MGQNEPREYVPPPAPPTFGRGGSFAAGQDPKRRSEAELEEAVERHRQEASVTKTSWWKRLFRRSS